MDLDGYLAFATEIAWEAGRVTLGHFQRGVEVMWKEDASPVTVADRASEELLRARIERRYPDHAIVGEEYGASHGAGQPFRWILDPIDGTRSFIQDVPLYAVLVGLEIEGEMAVGVAHFPALGEMVAAARGGGCRWNGRPCRVSNVETLDRSLLCYSDGASFRTQGRGAWWERLVAASGTQRGWGDAYGHVLVATGRAEAMFDPIMNIWDCAALKPIVEEAGGTFTDWSGTPAIDADEAISTNGRVLDEILRLREHNG